MTIKYQNHEFKGTAGEWKHNGENPADGMVKARAASLQALGVDK